MKDKAGTRAFMAPETWKKGKYKGKPTDIWASGASLYYMVLGEIPFKGKSYFALKDSVLNS